VLLGAVLAAVAGGAVPARPRTRIESAADLARGRAQGIAISAAGRLSAAPRVSRVGRVEALQVWSLVVGEDGRLFAGTGPDGQIVRLDSAGSSASFHRADRPLVTALALPPGGELLAATAPDGAIYRIRADGTARRWSETGERYVWALAPAADGRLFAGSGERGRVLEILESGDPAVYFDSGDTHIVSIAPTRDGQLIVGGAGNGVVYRIDPEGHALALYDDDLAEVVAAVPAEDGAVFAALLARLRAEPRPPALRLRLPEADEVGSADEGLGPLEDGPTLRGRIEGLPAVEAPPVEAVRGRVVRIDPDGRVTELWASDREAPLCAALDRLGRLWFGTGEPARLRRIERDGTVSLLATLDEGQATRLLLTEAGAGFLATSNPAAIYRVGPGTAGDGVFVSEPIDAGALARWGTIRWQVERSPAEAELYTRTGNSAVPDPTWSAWSPALTDTSGSSIVNPDGRYLQWRVLRLGEAVVFDVALDYEPYNRPPALRSFRLDLPARPEGPMRLRFAAADPDGDRVEVRIEARAADDAGWKLAGTVPLEEPGPAGGDVAPREGSFSWGTRELAEGTYELRAIVSDAPANPPGEGHEADAGPPLRVVIDRTPPRIEVRHGGDGWYEVTVEDAHSPIRRLEVVESGRVSHAARPLDGVCDSRAERFRLPRSGIGDESGRILRGTDAAGNVGESALAPR